MWGWKCNLWVSDSKRTWPLTALLFRNVFQNGVICLGYGEHPNLSIALSDKTEQHFRTQTQGNHLPVTRTCIQAQYCYNQFAFPELGALLIYWSTLSLNIYWMCNTLTEFYIIIVQHFYKNIMKFNYCINTYTTAKFERKVKYPVGTHSIWLLLKSLQDVKRKYFIITTVIIIAVVVIVIVIIVIVVSVVIEEHKYLISYTPKLLVITVNCKISFCKAAVSFANLHCDEREASVEPLFVYSHAL